MNTSISPLLLERLSEPAGHLVCDRKMMVLHHTPKVPSILGWTTQSESDSLVIRTPCSAGSTIALHRTLTRALEGGAAAEMVLLFFPNPRRIVEISIAPVGEASRPDGLEILCRDTSWYYEEHNSRKEMLRIAERITHWVHVAAMAIEMQSGRMHASSLAPDLLGIPRSAANFDLEAWLERVAEQQRQPFSEQVRKLRHGDAEHLHERILYTLHEGHELWLQVEGSILWSHQEGETPSMLLLFQDVTQQVQQEQEQRRQEQFDTQQALIGTWSINICSGQTNWSQELLRIHNLDPETFHGDLFTIFASLSSDDQRILTEEFRQPHAEAHARSRICHMTLPDGQLRHIHVHWECMRENGQPALITGFCMDISQVLHSSRRLREYEENSLLMMSALPDILLVLEYPSWKIMRNNSRASEILGLSRRSLTKRSLFDVCDESEAVLAALHKGDGVAVQATFHSVGGEALPCELRMVAININGHEQRMLMARDLRALERLQKNLWEIQERFHQIADNTSDMFWLMDPQTQDILYVNHALWDIIGLQENIRETPFRLLDLGVYNKEELRTGLAKLKPLIKGKAPQIVFEHRVFPRTGGERIIRATCFPVRDPNGKLIRIGGICTDITPFREAQKRQKLQEEQLRQADKMASLGVLVSGVAHEINNPNNLIMMNAALLTKIWKDLQPILEKEFVQNPDLRLNRLPYSVLRTEMAELLHGLTKGSERIRTIVHGLKEFVRIDNGRLNERVCLPKIIDDALLIVGNTLRKKTMHLHIGTTNPAIQVKGNAQQLEQVLINLLTNAAESLPSPEKAIAIACLREGDTAVLRVTDEGIGIPKAILGKILDPFFTTKRESGGTGLGLAVSYGIMEAHGGVLHFSSTEGQGTIAEMRLPLLPEEPHA